VSTFRLNVGFGKTCRTAVNVNHINTQICMTQMHLNHKKCTQFCKYVFVFILYVAMSKTFATKSFASNLQNIATI